MNKALLVAQREFVENLRTKTFWIGILVFPVLIGISVFVGRLLEDRKDVRNYAVLDRSEDQWLSAAVEEHAAKNDLRELLEKARSDLPDVKAEAEARVREWYDSLADDHPLRDLRTRLERLGADIATVDPGGGDAAMPAEVRREVMKWLGEVMGDPQKFRALKELSVNRFRRVRPVDLGDDPDAKLAAMVGKGELFAYFVLPEDPLAFDAEYRYVSNNLTDNDLRQWFARHATGVVRGKRIEQFDLSPEETRAVTASVVFAEKKVAEGGAVEGVTKTEKASNFAPVAFVYLLWIAIFTAAQMLLTNTVEEKSNRLVEVLLSSVSPLQLMSGKVLGIAATGLTIVLSWVVTALIGIEFIPSGSQVAELDLAGIVGDPLYLGSFVAYFLSGYLLYAAILVALGSVCNSLKEAQNLLQPVFILLIGPLIAMVFVVQDPNGTVARVLTYVPLYTPFLMMNRAGGPPPAWEYVASSILIAVSIAVAFWGAAKIFRIGILMTGKPPSVREILRWLRAPVAAHRDR